MAAIALCAMAWRAGGGAGLALLFSGLLLWFLLYYTRIMTIMKRAADRPIGYVGSAVMLNAKLKPRMPLLNVIALTRSLGERLSAEGAEPEVYRWRDPGDSHVTTEFEGGRLLRWQLQRPPVPSEPDAAPPLPAPGAES
jgi:hypothetical protein